MDNIFTLEIVQHLIILKLVCFPTLVDRLTRSRFICLIFLPFEWILRFERLLTSAFTLWIHSNRYWDGNLNLNRLGPIKLILPVIHSPIDTLMSAVLILISLLFLSFSARIEWFGSKSCLSHLILTLRNEDLLRWYLLLLLLANLMELLLLLSLLHVLLLLLLGVIHLSLSLSVEQLLIYRSLHLL